MQLASQALTADDRNRIAQAVVDAEKLTAAEIVPVVATSSGRYDRAEDLAGLWFAAAAAAVIYFVWPTDAAESGEWGGRPAWLEGAALVAAMLIGFIAGVLVAHRVGWLRRLFVPRSMLRAEAQARARQVFFDSRVHHTQTRAGLLVYVTLFEHQAVLLADAAVVERFGQAELDAACRQLSERLHTGRLADALCDTIAELGQRLGASLPRQADDVNEIADALIILDQPL